MSAPAVRRGSLRVIVAVVALASAGCGSGPGEHASGARPTPAAEQRLVDDAAGVSYAIPGGWTEVDDGLVEYFTSAITSTEVGEDDQPHPSEPVALVGAGRFESSFHDPGRDGLRDAAVSTVQGLAEFLIPPSEHDPVRHDEAIELDGRPAWRADYRVAPDDPDSPQSSVSLIAVDAATPFYLVAARFGTDRDLESDIEAVLASARIAR